MLLQPLRVRGFLLPENKTQQLAESDTCRFFRKIEKTL